MNRLVDATRPTRGQLEELAQCPMHKHQAAKIQPLQFDDELIFPMHKRVVTQYSSDESGNKELHLYYGDKEISFEENEYFDFGETLAKQERFVAGNATTWGDGYEWNNIQGLLETLIAEGILHYPSSDEVEAESTLGKSRPSPLAPSQISEPPTWFDCEALTEKLTGRALELGYLELVIPIFRVAHMSLDAEGRQVGEANVFPAPLRMDVPTDWRTCPHAGTRHQSDRPMNVTALKSMRAHWQQIMAVLLKMRNAYLARYPQARGCMTIGDIERLCVFVLSMPTYMLMRTNGRVMNGELSPVLSSMFRVTDGLRMVMHQMLFVPGVEANYRPEDVVTSAEVYEYAERNYSFHSGHGVCAGPQAMIEEFMRVLIDGVPARDTESMALDPQVQNAIDSMESIFDYSLLGLQAFFAVFSLWPVMTRTYDQLWSVIKNWTGDSSPAFEALRESLESKMQILKTATYHATEELRVARESAYSKLYDECASGLGMPPSEIKLADHFSPKLREEHAEVAAQLRSILYAAFCANGADAHEDAEKILFYLMNYFLQAQAILGVGCAIQYNINQLLERPQPVGAFNAADIDIHVILQGEEARRLPHLIGSLEAVLGIQVNVTKDEIEIKQQNHAGLHMCAQ
jgi:hypothetical protein